MHDLVDVSTKRYISTTMVPRSHLLITGRMDAGVVHEVVEAALLAHETAYPADTRAIAAMRMKLHALGKRTV